MAWEKAPAGLAEAFDRALPDDPRIERRKMFGCPCAFVGGNMFAGVHQSDLMVRLPEAGRQEMVDRHGARIFEPMPGRPMREYVVVPDRLRDDEPALRGWVGRAFEHAAALPPKEKKPPKARKKVAR